MKTCLSILLVALCACWADLPKLSSQEAELLKSIEQLPPEHAVRALEGKLPENASSAMLFSLGTLYYKANRLEQARKSFLQAVELAPDFDTARLNAVKVMMREQLHREAIPHLVRLLSTKADAELWLLLSQCRLCLREYLAAEKAASAAIALKPEEKEAQLILLQALASQPGRLAEASTLARQLLNSTPNDSRLWSIWASAELEADHPNKAMDILETAKHFGAADQQMLETLLDLTINRNFAQQATQLAMELHKQGKLSPQRAQTVLTYLQDAGHTQLAHTLLEVTASLLPEKALTAARSKQAALEGDTTTSIRLLRGSIAKEPMDGNALLALADLLEDQTEGDALLERALLLPDFKYQALLKLATRAIDSNHYPKALQFALQARQIKDTPELERFSNQIREIIHNQQE